MKTKSLIYRVGTAAMLSAGFLMSAPLLTSCSSEDTPVVDTPDPEGEATISLSISTPFLATTSTRAGDIANDFQTIAADANEAKINSIWLYIYQIDNTDDDKSEFFMAKNCSLPSTETNVLGYREILSNVSIPAGKYRFYVVANLDNYLSTYGESLLKPNNTGGNDFSDKYELNESDLKGLSLSFDHQRNTTTPFWPVVPQGSYLPMIARATDVSVHKDSNGAEIFNTTSGTIQIKSGAIKLQADMTFQCSAVRFSFFFDNTRPENVLSSEKENVGFSYPYRTMAMNSVAVKNVYTLTPILADANSNTTKKDITITSQCARYEYPSNLAEFINKPTTFTTKYTSSDETSLSINKYAYQGIIYLPENTSNDDKTNLVVNVIFDGETEKTFTINLPNYTRPNCDDNVNHNTDNEGENKLKRGHFYDVIGRFTAAGMEFNVKVNDWILNPRDTFEL